ncbi:MAG: DUF4956 domain-containing protein [Deltaproteobacteria bacterium]|nr:DUF4956 domain-containing protein [Deltaproteobacteria bacterium]
MLDELLAWFLDVYGANEFMDIEAVAKLVVRLGTDLFFTTLIVRFVYVRRYRWNDQVFTYFIFNLITFSLCFLLRKVPIELGFALGLFAVFGILRYRTEPIRIRDLTYLFVVIGLAILNALANKKISVAELLVMNIAIVGLTYTLEYVLRHKYFESKLITYDDLELLKPGREAELRADLRARTGLVIARAEVMSVNLLRDTAEITVYCVDAESGAATLEPAERGEVNA